MLREKVLAFTESAKFTWFIATLLVINAVVLGLQTDLQIVARYGHILNMFDEVILGIFVIEIALRIYAHRWSFFKGGWNIFDFLIVGISLVPSIGPFAMLRTLRIFRVTRLMSVVPKMRRVVTALLSALPGMASICAVLLVIFYIASVLTTQMFGRTNDPVMDELFGSIGDSMFTLFQLMTLEGWSAEIAAPTMAHYPHAWIFFVVFIIITTFAVLNLFIGIIVDAMQTMHEEDNAAERDRVHDEDLAILHDLRNEMREIRALLEKK